ncbi:uncharacterized protein J3R85_000945 [Psidium guajava]|nr:uncharacterized protein J3R85_000945 [Psidium guajava]
MLPTRTAVISHLKTGLWPPLLLPPSYSSSNHSQLF